MKTLSIKPYLHPEAVIDYTNLGEYTEIGPRNHLQNTTLERYGYTGPDCIIQNTKIGPFANIAAMVRIGPTDHPIERPTQHHFTYRREMFGLGEDEKAFFERRAMRLTTIGPDVWIGHGAIILPELTIGTGAVIGAGAVVTKDIPDYAIAVGTPARVIRYRFPEELIPGLLATQWWNWSHQELKERMEDFCDDAEAFVKKYANIKEAVR